MARILFNEISFDELAPGSMLEADFEGIIIDKASAIFPGFYIVPFKTSVYSEDDCAKPDLALIEKNYRQWWVAEVELCCHSLMGHVLPQVRTLSRASYGDDEGKALCEKGPDLDRFRVRDMLKGKQPRVLVIVDSDREDWVVPLKRHDAELFVLQIFRSDRNEYVFRTDGHLPNVPQAFISECNFDSLVPRFLVVHSPAHLGVGAGQKISIRFGNFTTDWKRIDCQDKVWLAPAGRNPLLRNQNYQIVKGENGALEFREVFR